MWPVRRAVVFVASTIADFPAHPPKDFKFLHYTSVIYKPWTFFAISVFTVILLVLALILQYRSGGGGQLDMATSGAWENIFAIISFPS